VGTVLLDHSTEQSVARRGRRRVPLYVQIGVAILVGWLLGESFGEEPILPGTHFGNQELGRLATLFTALLKSLAAPLIFFAVLDSFLRTNITWERGGKLVTFCLLNVTVAMAIGLVAVNTFRPGEAWRGRFQEMSAAVTRERTAGPEHLPATPSFTFIDNLARLVPANILQPFLDGNLMVVVAFALIVGAAYRKLAEEDQERDVFVPSPFEKLVEICYRILVRILEWIVRLLPLAVLGAVAHAVSSTGSHVFRLVAVFFIFVSAGLAVHAFVYYPLVAWLYGGKSPRVYLGFGWEALVTGLSTNSSLATMPVTLRVLTEKMGVSDQSARLAACVGTNFNNDGITLYEAMTAIFLAQAIGLPLTLAGQIQTVAICVLASIGAAGIPQGGLVVLPLVLASAGLSPEVIGLAMPLIMTVDPVVARFRSCVNVLGDMLVAIQLDRSRKA